MLVAMIVVVMALGLTILAFVVKDKVSSAVLHAVGMIAWTIVAYLLYNVGGYPAGNPFLPTAVMMIALSVAIVHTVFVVIPLLSYFRGPPPPSYDADQAQIRSRIAKITTRRRREEPW